MLSRRIRVGASMSETPTRHFPMCACPCVLVFLKKVDIEASNRKGRTALSFAACPSHNGSVPRETPVAALRLLLESGADSKHKDERGKTAKDHASNEKREEALAVFAQLGL